MTKPKKEKKAGSTQEDSLLYSIVAAAVSFLAYTMTSFLSVLKPTLDLVSPYLNTVGLQGAPAEGVVLAAVVGVVVYLVLSS